ncbi:MAG: hypothetical protein ACK4RK_12350 [Gemmataceae bacterium]
MTRETKIGLAITTSFLTMVSVVLFTKLHGESPTGAPPRDEELAARVEPRDPARPGKDGSRASGQSSASGVIPASFPGTIAAETLPPVSDPYDFSIPENGGSATNGDPGDAAPIWGREKVGASAPSENAGKPIIEPPAPAAVAATTKPEPEGHESFPYPPPPAPAPSVSVASSSAETSKEQHPEGQSPTPTLDPRTATVDTPNDQWTPASSLDPTAPLPPETAATAMTSTPDKPAESASPSADAPGWTVPDFAPPPSDWDPPPPAPAPAAPAHPTTAPPAPDAWGSSEFPAPTTASSAAATPPPTEAGTSMPASEITTPPAVALNSAAPAVQLMQPVPTPDKSNDNLMLTGAAAPFGGRSADEQLAQHNNPRVSVPLGSPARASSPPIAPQVPNQRPPVFQTPQVMSYDEEMYRAQPNDTIRGICQRFYHHEKYEQALLAFNRSHPMASEGLRMDPPQIAPGQPIFIPPLHILKARYGAAIPGYGVASADIPTAPAPRPPSPPGGAGQTSWSNPGIAKFYKVGSANETFRDVARKTLNNPERWMQIYQLNPTFDPKIPLPIGAELRMPEDAHINPANAP